MLPRPRTRQWPEAEPAGSGPATAGGVPAVAQAKGRPAGETAKLLLRRRAAFRVPASGGSIMGL